MAKGTIKNLLKGRGYHSTGLQGADFESLKEGQAVEYETEQGPKGLRAINIRLKKE